MTYMWLQLIHLTAAAFFIGGVFFEVMIISRAARQLPPDARQQFGKAFGNRAKRIMPWVILVLFATGLTMAGHYYRGVLAQPLSSNFGTLLALKIILAFSVLGHFLTVMILMRRNRLTSKISHWIHRSVLLHMFGILFLAKAMFVLHW